MQTIWCFCFVFIMHHIVGDDDDDEKTVQVIRKTVQLYYLTDAACLFALTTTLHCCSKSPHHHCCRCYYRRRRCFCFCFCFLIVLHMIYDLKEMTNEENERIRKGRVRHRGRYTKSIGTSVDLPQNQIKLKKCSLFFSYCCCF